MTAAPPNTFSLENVNEGASARRVARTVGGPRKSDACRPVEDTEFILGMARKLRNGLDEHRRALAKAKPLRYCIWQCGPDKCCKRGSVTIDRFPVVRNTLVNKDGDDGSDATLVTQGTANRIHAFGNISEVWPGPKVVLFAIYNHTAERAEQATFERNAVVAASAAWNNTKTMIFMIEHHPNMDTYSRQITDPMLALYPVNTLRNVVMDSAPTNWVFTLDIDFKPSATLYRNLVDLQLSRLNLVDRAAVVIPHFEIVKNKCTNRYPPIPEAFDEMEQQMLAGSVIPFHVEPTVLIPALPVAVGKCFKMDRVKSWPQGIGASNYSRWYYESAQGLGGFIRLTSISMIPDKYLVKFWEPFLMVRRFERPGSKRLKVVPRYEEMYIGRYRNKVSFVTRLRAERYKFYSILREFTIHMPHVQVNNSATDSKVLYKLMTKVDGQFRERLDKDLFGKQDPFVSPFNDGWQCRIATSPHPTAKSAPPPSPGEHSALLTRRPG
jgi:hypothetical protein